MDALPSQAARALAIALVGDGCRLQWLLSAAGASEATSTSINQLAEEGLLRLVLADDGTVTVKVLPAVATRVNPETPPQLASLARAWAVLRRGCRDASPLSPAKRLGRAAPPHQVVAAVPPTPPPPVIAALQQGSVATVTGVGPPGSEPLQRVPELLGQARWVPFRAPLIVAWPGHAIFSRGTELLVTRHRRVADDLAEFARFLHRHAAALSTMTLAHVVHLLQTGATDTSAARHLGMSERHFRRQVASVMETVDATSRWQAASRVERGHWQPDLSGARR